MQGFVITNDIAEMDVTVIHSFLTNSYWAKGISIDLLEKALTNSLCFGIIDDKGSQVGFARLITDLATFAYLADVFILPGFRGKGLSKWLMESIFNHSDLQGLRRILLATSDAHGLYSQYGFSQLGKPSTFMECWNPNVYEQIKQKTCPE